MIKINCPNPVPKIPYKYKFCGLPIGVSILPRFAARVCNTTTGIISRCLAVLPSRLSTVKVKGTKVIKATSFVINILVKKHSITSIKMKPI